MGGYEQKPGASSLVQAQAAGVAGGTPGKSTLTERLGAAQGAPTTYAVQAGETLQAIAAKLRTTVDALKAANAGKLKSYPTRSGGTVQGFNAGEVITVPGAAAKPAPASSTDQAAAPAPSEGGFFESMLGTLGDAFDSLRNLITGGPATGDHPTPDAGTAPSPGTGGTPATDATPATAPMADLTDAQRGEKLSTFHADELGTLDDFGMSETGRDGAKARGEWLSVDAIKAAGLGKSGAAYVDSVDALVEKTSFSEDQDKILTSAKEFASAPRALTPEQEQKAVLDWSKAQLTLDGVSLNEDLKSRLVRYVRFLAWAGLVTGPTKIGSVMRSPQDAHKLSVAWMFNVGANASKGSTLHKAENRQKLVKTVTDKGGSDMDGNQWLSEATVEGLKSRKDDDAELFQYIKTTAAPEANKVQKQKALAAEGYTTADRRHPNVLGGSRVSNHLLGEAVDMYPPFVFNNKFDPMIDAIAMYFGLWRAVKDDKSSPEHWHYERLGMPPGAEADDDAP